MTEIKRSFRSRTQSTWIFDTKWYRAKPATPPITMLIRIKPAAPIARKAAGPPTAATAEARRGSDTQRRSSDATAKVILPSPNANKVAPGKITLLFIKGEVIRNLISYQTLAGITIIRSLCNNALKRLKPHDIPFQIMLSHQMHT